MTPASDAKLLDAEWTGEPLLTFKTPARKTIAKLGEILERMPIVPTETKTQSPHKASAATSTGPIAAILAELERVLRQDYQETIEDVKEWDGEFDYVVTTSNVDPGAVHVLTRLFHPEKGGNIFYGRTVQRVSADTFLLWVDD